MSAAAPSDLYEVLGLSRDASEAAIKKAYRKLVRRHHPDVNPGDSAAEDRFKEISAAYETLSDPEKRKLYDEFGEDAARTGFDPEQARAHRAWQEHAQWQGGGRRSASAEEAEALFRELFGDGQGPFGAGSAPFGGGQARRGRRGADLHADLTLSFRAAALGGQRELAFEDGRTLKVRIPAGVEDGERIRLRKKGAPGQGGEPPGDLRITIHVTPDRRFERRGQDLHLDVPISIGEAMRGAKVTVPTLRGPEVVVVPAGVSTGATLRIRGKGIEREGRPTGDFFVHLQVHVPKVPVDERLGAAIDVIEAAYPSSVRAGLFDEEAS